MHVCSKDIGIWTLRECADGFRFVAAARRCKSVRSIRRQETLCSGARSNDYDFCPADAADEVTLVILNHVAVIQCLQYTIQETRSSPRRCACPDGSSDCLCARPEILEPVKVARRTRTTESARSTSSGVVSPTVAPPAAGGGVKKVDGDDAAGVGQRFQSFGGSRCCNQPSIYKCCTGAACVCPTTRVSRLVSTHC